MMNSIKDIMTKSTDFKTCFGTVEGERVLKDLLHFCKYRDSTFVSGDPHATAFNEGMRRVALRVIKFLNMSEEEISRISHLKGS